MLVRGEEREREREREWTVVCANADSQQCEWPRLRVPSDGNHASLQSPLITTGSASSRQRVLMFRPYGKTPNDYGKSRSGKNGGFFGPNIKGLEGGED